MKAPVPHTITGKTLEEALTNYMVYAEYLLVNNPSLAINFIQVIAPATIVFFTEIDDMADVKKMQRETLGLVKDQLGAMGNSHCAHEYDTSLKCIKCGSQLT